jgi:hypothetical protein
LGARKQGLRVVRVDDERVHVEVGQAVVRRGPGRAAVAALEDAVRLDGRVDVAVVARVDGVIRKIGLVRGPLGLRRRTATLSGGVLIPQEGGEEEAPN